MGWVERFFHWLFGTTPARVAKADDSVHSPDNADAEIIYAHDAERNVGARQQHRWLFDEGVMHWNQHRHAPEFQVNFAGINFVKESVKSRLWGRPGDLIGEERVILSGVDFHRANLEGCILTKADLRGANLRGASLRNAKLNQANLSNADLTDCDLRGAILDGAILARAKLNHANLSGASLKGTNFAWADLRFVIGGTSGFAEASLFGAMRDNAAAGIQVTLPASRPHAPEVKSAEIRIPGRV